MGISIKSIILVLLITILSLITLIQSRGFGSSMSGGGGSAGSVARAAAINHRMGGFDSLYAGLSSNLSPYRMLLGPNNHTYTGALRDTTTNPNNPQMPPDQPTPRAGVVYSRWVPVESRLPDPHTGRFYSSWSADSVIPGSHPLVHGGGSSLRRGLPVDPNGRSLLNVYPRTAMGGTWRRGYPPPTASRSMATARGVTGRQPAVAPTSTPPANRSTYGLNASNYSAPASNNYRSTPTYNTYQPVTATTYTPTYYYYYPSSGIRYPVYASVRTYSIDDNKTNHDRICDEKGNESCEENCIKSDILTEFLNLVEKNATTNG